MRGGARGVRALHAPATRAGARGARTFRCRVARRLAPMRGAACGAATGGARLAEVPAGCAGLSAGWAPMRGRRRQARERARAAVVGFVVACKVASLPATTRGPLARWPVDDARIAATASRGTPSLWASGPSSRLTLAIPRRGGWPPCGARPASAAGPHAGRADVLPETARHVPRNGPYAGCQIAGDASAAGGTIPSGSARAGPGDPRPLPRAAPFPSAASQGGGREGDIARPVPAARPAT